MLKGYDLNKCMSEYLLLRSERSEWEAEWRSISEYLLPGRGIYQYLSTPRKRTLTSPNVINTTGREALKVLTAGLQGGLTSPSRPWLDFKWADKQLNQIDFLRHWLQDTRRIVEAAFHDTNFYPTMHSFYTEYGGFGNGSVFIDSTPVDKPFSFHLLTAGEYVFSTDAFGRADKMYRIIFRSPRQMYELYGDKCSEAVKDIVNKKSPAQEKVFILVLECILPVPYKDKPFTQLHWELGGAVTSFGDASLMDSAGKSPQTPVRHEGFYEFPAPVGRWDTLGQDTYGIGPGSEALAEIKRLQEMEKGMRMAVHKDINPPLNAPAYMRGQLKTLPGGINYYRNVGEKVDSIYSNRVDYNGIAMMIERVESKIKNIFFNDIFLTSARDPNASPMKAAEVHVKEGEKMLRLGPVIERINPEFLTPVVKRSFNILMRKGYFPEIPPEYLEMLSGFEIHIVSPLAQAQKLVASQSIQNVLAFAGQAAQIAPQVLDKFNLDRTVDEVVDANGAPLTMMNSEEEVKAIRDNRAKQQQEEKARKEGMEDAQMQAAMGNASATDQKTRAEAGQIMTESLVDQQALGGLQ